MEMKTPQQILHAEEQWRNALIWLGSLTAIGFSAWYWVGLPTHQYTKFTAATMVAAVLGFLFVLVYEITKLLMAKSGQARKSLLFFVGFSIITAVGTHMSSEQAITEEKASKSAVLNTALDGMKEAQQQAAAYGYAKSFDLDQLHAKKDALLKQKAVDAKGKETDYTVGFVVSKGWKSYASYADQVKSIDDDIRAKQLYDGSQAALASSSSTAQATNATQSTEANWLMQLVGSLMLLFFPGIEKINVWATFVFYAFASALLELSLIRNGERLGVICKVLYGFNPTNLDEIDAIVLAQRAEAPALPAPAAPALAAPNHVDTPTNTNTLDTVSTRVDTPDANRVDTPDVDDSIAAQIEAALSVHDQEEPSKPAITLPEILRSIIPQIWSMVQSGALPSTRNSISSTSIRLIDELENEYEMPIINYQQAVDIVYSKIKTMQLDAQTAAAAKAAKAPTPPPQRETFAIASAQADNEPPRRPMVFVDTNSIPTVYTPVATALPIAPTAMEESVLNRVDTPNANRVDTPTRPIIDTPAPHADTLDVDAETRTRAIGIIWDAIDRGIVTRISQRDSSQCQTALKAHEIGKSNPARRAILNFVFDALAKEGVLTSNPDYTESGCGKPEWLINQDRTIRYNQ